MTPRGCNLLNMAMLIVFLNVNINTLLLFKLSVKDSKTHVSAILYLHFNMGGAVIYEYALFQLPTLPYRNIT